MLTKFPMPKLIYCLALLLLVPGCGPSADEVTFREIKAKWIQTVETDYLKENENELPKTQQMFILTKRSHEDMNAYLASVAESKIFSNEGDRNLFEKIYSLSKEVESLATEALDNYPDISEELESEFRQATYDLSQEFLALPTDNPQYQLTD